MKSSFDYYKRIESPEMYLCNPDQRFLCALNGEDRILTLRFNDLSELTFTVPKIEGTESSYNLVETKRLVFVDKIGWFQITTVTETIEGDKCSKSVTAKSHQTVFSDRGFVTEERVYMFYNPNDPLDEKYDSNNKAAIPSVCGQLYKQLGIRIALNKSDIEPSYDRKDWTLIYIDPILHFHSRSYSGMYEPDESFDNICRSFEANSETNGYDFMVNQVEEAFEVIFEFDFLYHTIKVKTIEDITTPTSIYLSFENVINTLDVKENAEEIVTVMTCDGNDLDIRTVNPMGTNYIVDFSYYKRLVNDDGVEYPWMSKELIKALDDWEVEFNRWRVDDSSRTGHTKGYSTLVKEVQALYEQKAQADADIQYANLKLTDMQAARDQYLDGDDKPLEGSGYVMAESVDVGSKSMLSKSRFYTTPFSDTVTITGHTKGAKATKVTDDNGGYHYEFSFDDAGRSGTPRSFIETYIDSEKIEDNANIPFYFMDEDNRSYCKLTVEAEVGVVKDADGFISGNGTVEVKGVTFTVTTNNGVYTITLPNGQTITASQSNSYFVYNGTRYRILSGADEIVTLYGFFISGFERYTTYAETKGNTGWVDIWQNHINRDLKPVSDALQQDISAIEAEMAYICEQCSIKEYIQRRSQDLYNELSVYWIEGSYSNDNFATYDTTTMAERIDLANELMDAAKKDLAKSAQPQFELTVDSINFIKILEFKQFTDELELGKVITIEREDGVYYRPALMTLEYNLDSTDTFTMTFSNASKPGDTSMTFADLIKESSSISRTVAANWSSLTDYTRNKDDITSLIMAPLDRTLRAAQDNMSRQQFIVDETGILGRKWSDDSQTTFEKEQIRIINNTILFTNDNWETAALALGRVHYGDNKEAYGLVASVLVGELILGEAMSIGSKSERVRIDDSGIVIKNDDGDDVFYGDPNGNLTIKGTIRASAGNFGVLTIENDGSITSTTGHFSVDKNGNLIAKGGGTIGGYTITDKALTSGNVGMSSDTTSGAYAFWAGNTVPANALFSVTNEGVMNAQAGQIGGIHFTPLKDTSGLYNDEFFLGTARNESTQNLETILGFGAITRDADGLRFTPDTLLTDSIVRSPSGEFTTITGSSITAWNSVRAMSILAPSSISSTTGFYFGYGNGSAYYTARLTVSGVTIWLRIYNQNGQEVTLDEAKTFTVHYACIWGGDTVWNATVPAGSSSTSKNTNAFWGVDYYTFSAPATSKSNHSYSFLVSGDSAANNITSRGNLLPYTDGTFDLGSGARMWNMIYCSTSAADLSDSNEKHDIVDISEIYDRVFDKLRPVTFKFNKNTSNRTHIGLTGQNLKAAIIDSGLTTQECAAYCEWETGEGDIGCGIRYGELVPLNIWEIQKLKERVALLEEKLMKQ